MDNWYSVWISLKKYMTVVIYERMNYTHLKMWRMNNMALSNIVKEKKLREVQLDTLKVLSDAVSLTAGPYGEYTQILNDPNMGNNKYTKDGHKVLTNIKFYEPLELSIQDEVTNATRNIVKTVGDGTTSVVKIMYNVFKALCEFEESHKEITKFQMIDTFKHACSIIEAMIKENGRELDIEDVYKICMVSTDGNEEVSGAIAKIYQDYGKDVYINIDVSNTPEHYIKTSNGLTMERGFASPCFVNKNDNTCTINNPRVYFFDDPIDTPEMGNLFSTILTDNIFTHMKDGQFVPTVIMAHSISRDYSCILEEMEKLLYKFEGEYKVNKPPVLIVSGLNRYADFYNDLIVLTGAKSIKKFIDPEVREQAIKDGNCPTTKTVTNFYGMTEQVISDNGHTTFVNPDRLYEKDELGRPTEKHSSDYIGLLEFLKSQIESEKQTGNDITTIHMLEKRLRALQSSYVEYFVGGIAESDRENVRDLVEDAVLNCRSAAQTGVGFGANFEMLRASEEWINDNEHRENTLLYHMVEIIQDAAKKSILALYKSYNPSSAEDNLLSSLDKQDVLNIRTGQFQKDVLCSINCDIMILDTVSRLVTLLFNTNQALLVNPLSNKYRELDNVDDGTEKNPNV